MAQYSSGFSGMDEEMYIAGTQYFALSSQVYGFNQINGLIFPVNEACMPLSPTISIPGPGINIRICDIWLRITGSGALEWWGINSSRWEPVDLVSSYGDVFSTTGAASLLGSLRGMDLDCQFDLECNIGREHGPGLPEADREERFYSYGNPPTLESIHKWVEDGKQYRAPTVCPLKGCGKELRRPHALKDHLLFKFNIRVFQCGFDGCGKLFPTKTNSDRHMKDCKLGSGAVGNY
ncbi:unnamed protein product [Rhizoctonia solani]|uniref:C2H2-type domain-containing protein n=1 Tax=Rhizoctonia solani TaxID=456999 RepID=A0A8H2Y4Q5_9AGAM|nr:unnamed protein product [Rhizoctonia solani]